jgi:pilus assembly protein CpaF
MKTGTVDTGVEDRIRKELFSRIQGKDFLQFPLPDRRRVIQKIIKDIADTNNIVLPDQELNTMAKRIDEDSFDVGPISYLLKDPAVTEIMINDFERVYIEKEGMITRESVGFKDNRHIKNIVEKILGPLGLRVDESNPMVDARLDDGSRINVVISPVSKNDIVVTIRKFKDDMKSMDQLIQADSLSRDMAEFLSDCVRRKINILVSGGTGTGKTTLLNLLSASIDEEERIVTVEETLELRFDHKNLVRLEARPPNIEGRGEVAIRDLVRNSLRMRPGRIIVGEIRGSEAVDVLQAMNTGHSGSMTTIHANSPLDAITRLETMLLISGHSISPFTAERIIATSLDMIVHLEKTGNGQRVVHRVSEVLYRTGVKKEGERIIRIEDIAITEDQGSAAVFTGYNPSFLKV